VEDLAKRGTKAALMFTAGWLAHKKRLIKTPITWQNRGVPG